MRTGPLTMALAATGLVCAVLTVAGRAQEQAIDPIVASWDKGSDKIDVSKYPEDMKKRYKTFASLCVRCHTLARAVNCDFVLDDDWERYIKKMMRRGKGLISPDDGMDIFEFAVYDSKMRKRELYAKRMAERKASGGA